jgi:hypothetical protein
MIVNSTIFSNTFLSLYPKTIFFNTIKVKDPRLSHRLAGNPEACRLAFSQSRMTVLSGHFEQTVNREIEQTYLKFA